MWRSRPARLVVSVGVAALLAALGGVQAFAQQAVLPSPRSLLRSTVDDDDTARRDRRAVRPGTERTATERSAPLQVTPPAFGAGLTGFDSTNRGKRRVRPGVTKQGRTPTGTATLPAPLSLTPSPSSAPAPATPPTPATTSTTTTPAPATTGSVVTLRGPAGRPTLVRVPSGPAADSDGTVISSAHLTPTQVTLLRRRTAIEEDPFSQLGIRYGAFLVLPAVEVTGGYDTGPGRVPGAPSSSFVVVAPELNVRSDWQRHEFTAALRGSYTTYQQVPELDRPTFDGKIAGRIDVTQNTRILLEGIGLLGTDNPGSPNVQAGLSRFPIYTTVGGTFGIAQRFNRLEVTAKGAFDRTEYQDSHFTDGTTGSNADRDFNRYGGMLRVAYDLIPGMRPFIEGGADTRKHDVAVDRFGLMRDSDGWYLKAGTTFEFSRKLTGEISLGWLDRSYKDPTLQQLSGFTVDGSLVYAMSALTNMKFTASTAAAETTVPGTAGVFTRNAGVEVEHTFRRWLIGSLKFNYGFDDYVGSLRKDDRFAVAGSIVYKVNRVAQIKAEVREEWLRSSTPVGVGYTATVFMLGMRLQR